MIMESMFRSGPYIIMLILSLFVCYQIYLASTDIYADSNNVEKYLLNIIIPVVLFMLLTVYVTFDKQSRDSIFVFIGMIAVVMIFLYLFLQTSVSTYVFNNYLLYSIVAIIGIVGLAIIYAIFEGKLKRMKGITGFIINMIFYIPCMLYDFSVYMLNQYFETPSVVFVLFIIEILLIILFLYLGSFISYMSTGEKHILLDRPVFLDSKFRIDNELIKSAGNKVIDPTYVDNSGYGPSEKSIAISQSPYRTNYAISMWVYINPMPVTKLGYAYETNIFEYTDIDGKGHPNITYSVDKKTRKDALNVYVSSDVSFNLPVTYQRWNNYVFNYDKNGVDLFVNGNLERTIQFSSNNHFPKYTTNDIISVGDDNGLDNNNGLYGAICNVVYYSNPLSRDAIINNYNLLTIKNPPIF